MVVNIKDVRMVVHYGPPRQIEDYIQEVGRGGRDMYPAKAILLFTGNQLRRCEDNVKKLAKSSNTCMRKILLQDFDNISSDFEHIDTHNCCIICHMKCKCDKDKCLIPTLDISPDIKKTPLSEQGYSCNRRNFKDTSFSRNVNMYSGSE